MNEQSYGDLSFLKPRDPSITHPLQRPHPGKGKNLFCFYGCSSEEVDDKGIKVFLRIKPRKCRPEEQEMMKIQNQSTLLLKGLKDPNVEYKFTKIFGPETNQETMFEECVHPCIQGFISGQNCLLFAYGASGAGKTFTVQGTPENPGIILRAITAVFNSIKGQESSTCRYKPHMASSVLELDDNTMSKELLYKQSLLSTLQKSDTSYSLKSLESCIENTFSSLSEISISSISSLGMRASYNETYCGEVAYSVWVSFVEIYNEQIFDLLVPQSNRKRQGLILGQDSAGDVYIKGLNHVWVNSAKEAYQMLLFGQHNLNYAPTSLNAASSRSHCVFSLKLVCEFTEINRCRLSRFSFCDLAGAERAKKTENVGERLRESQKINTSLHYLGMCLRIIRDNQNSKEKAIIPFRDSKLTRLFQKALLGREAVRMIVNVSRDPFLYDETSHVLKFSAIAKQIVLQERRPHPMRKESRFSRYIKRLSNASKFTSIMEDESYAQNTTNPSLLNQRIEELVNEVAKLKLQLDTEKRDKVTLERRIRENLADRYDKLLEETETRYKTFLEEKELHYLEMEHWRSNKMEEYIEKMSKKRKRCSNDSWEEQDELEKQLESLSVELSAAQELLEAGKVENEDLRQQNSKLQFQLSDITEKFNIANMANRMEGSELTEDIVGELKEKLYKKTEELNKKNKEIQNLEEVIKDAKDDYEQLEESHNAVVKELEELEKNYEDKTTELRDAQEKLNICHKQFEGLYSILDSKDEEIESLKTEGLKDIEELDCQMKLLIEGFEEAVTQAQEINANFKSEVEASQDSVTKLLTEMSDCSNVEIQRLETELEALEQKFKSAQSRIEEVVHTNECLRREANDTLLLKQDLEEKLMAMEKNYKQILKEVITARNANEEQQKTMQDCKLASEKEITHLKDQLQTYVSSTHKLKQELEGIHVKYQNAEEENEMIINQLKEKELEMKSFKTNRDKIFRTYEEKLRKEKEATDVHKREIQRLQELFIKNTPNTPNKKEYEEKLHKLTNELEKKDEELKKCYARLKAEDKNVVRRHRRKIVDENAHPSQWITRHMQSPAAPSITAKQGCSGTSSTKVKKSECRSEDKQTAKSRRKLYSVADDPGNFEPTEYEDKNHFSPVRVLRSRHFDSYNK